MVMLAIIIVDVNCPSRRQFVYRPQGATHNDVHMIELRLLFSGSVP